jgi:hypothetical protein
MEEKLYLFDFIEGSARGMAKVELKTNQKTEVEDSSSLKGTFVSVMFLGAFIVVTWVSVYLLFVNRF